MVSENGTGLQIGILGPLEVRRDGVPIPIGRAKQRALLALLATETGRTVSVDRMVDELWGDEPPSKAAASLQAYVSNLRKLLEPDRPKGSQATVLVTEQPGYRLDLPEGAVDAARFEALSSAGRVALDDGAVADALDTTTLALGLWRGSALEEFRNEDFAIATVARLEERRRSCEEDRLTAMVELGLLSTAVAELEAAVREEPLREARWALLMRALYATGRHAEALERFQEVRRGLGEDLGLEPGPELVDLERRVLAHDPDLARPTTPPRRPASAASSTPARSDVAVSWPTPTTDLVERDAELAHVDAAVAAISEGRSRILVVEGEAGMGKTTLVRALGDRCALLGIDVGWGSCHDDADAPSLWPWLQALGSLGVDVEPPAGSDVFGHLESLTTALTRRAVVGPVACIIEDLHWADPTTLRLLSFMAIELRNVPVLIAVTARADEARAVLDPMVAGLLRHPGATHVPLRPLSPEGTDALARAVAGERLDNTDGLHGSTGGNPLFVSELARLLAAEGPHAGIPPGVREVIARRLDRLPEDATSLLVLAAIAGDDTELELLARAAGMELDRVADVLDTAVAIGVLRISPASGRVSFAHALVRDTVLDPVADLQRRRLHARLAQTWAEFAGGAGVAYERARHAVQAIPLVPSAEARLAAMEAAAAAEVSADHATAEHWWARALEITDASDELGTDSTTRGAVLLSLAAAHHRAGADDSAQDVIIEALDDAADRGDTAQAAAAAAALGDTGGVWLWVRPGMDPLPLIERVERVAAALDEADLTARAQVLGTLAIGHVGTDPDRADDLSAEALDLARRSGDLAVLGRALSARWGAIWRPGRYAEQREVGRELDELAGRLADADLRLSAAVCMHIAALGLADVAEATVQLDRVLEMARARHLRFVEAQVLPQVATLAALRGDLAEAETAVEAVRRCWTRMEFGGTDTGDAVGAMCLWLVRREQGRLAELAPSIEAVLGAPPVPDRRWHAVALAATDRPEEARAALVGPDIGRVGPWYAGSGYAVLDAELAADLDMEELAALIAEELTPLIDELAMMGTAGCYGPIALSLGRVAVVAGRVELADRAFRRAIELCDRGGLRAPATWARIHLAELLRTAGIGPEGTDSDEATSLLAQARATATELGLVVAAEAAAG